MSSSRSLLGSFSFPIRLISSYSTREFHRVRSYSTKVKRVKKEEVGGRENVNKRERRVDFWAVKQTRYTRHIANLIRKGKVEEAEGVFQDMLEAKVRPSTAVFNHLISGFSHQGNAETAFKYFNNLKKRGLQPSHHTYTSLFKAITEAGSSSSHILDKVIAEIDRRDFPLNTIATNSMMVAMTTCGMQNDVLVAYGDMDKRRVAPDVGTFTILLTSSAMDRENGMERVAEIWREMKATGIKPDTVSYLTLLKCLRMAGIPDKMKTSVDNETLAPAFNTGDLHLLVSDKNSQSPESKRIKSIKYTRLRTNFEGSSPLIMTSKYQLNLHIFSGSPLTLHITDKGWRWMDKKSVQMFLSKMKDDGVAPDNQILDQLSKIAIDWPALVRDVVGVVSFSDIPETALLSAVQLQEKLGNGRGAEILRNFGQEAGILTQNTSYLSRASSCVSKHQGLSLLSEMKDDGVRLDSKVIGVLMRGAARKLDYEFVTALMKEIRHSRIDPDSVVMDILARLVNTPVPPSPRMKLRYNGFKGYLNIWKKHYDYEPRL